MSMSDPLADMLTRIRNAVMANFDEVKMPHSKLKFNIAKVLKEEGYIKDFHFVDNGKVEKVLAIDLKRDLSGTCAITGLKRESKPGRRVYAKHDQIPKIMSGLGVAILSTSGGLMTDRKARADKVGGEILCSIW